jgi:protein SCO1
MQFHENIKIRIGEIIFSVASVCLLITLTACTRNAEQPKRFELKGKVVNVDKSQSILEVDHEAIPGFMGAMSMPYQVKDAHLLDDLAPGDEITAVVVVSGGGVWLENIFILKKGTGASAHPGGKFHAPEEGDEVPGIELVNQSGKHVNLNSYRGKSVLLTFLYTRCPMPDFCPLMTRNFAAIEKALAQRPEMYSKTHLLSVSFDPKFDTPKVLASYGEKYVLQAGSRKFDHWEFVVPPEADTEKFANYFGLLYSEEKGLLDHSLSTVIISPQGKIFKWYPTNTWNPEDVLKDLESSLAGKPG